MVAINASPFQIVGVSEPGFSGAGLHAPVDLQIPSSMRGRLLGDARNNIGWAQLLARLKPGVRATEAQARLNALGQEIEKLTGPKMGEHDDSSEVRIARDNRGYATTACCGIRRLLPARTPSFPASLGLLLRRSYRHGGLARRPWQIRRKPLPLRTINRLEEGETLTYRPVLRSGEERKGEVALVVVPAEGVHAAEPLLVSPAKGAAKPQQWKIPWRTGIVALVYGPSGLSVNKVRGFLSKDSGVVGELADYADKTTKTEALIAELSSPNASSERFQSALQGFSSQFGLNTQIARGAPTDQETYAMFQALNPAVASYDPLSPQPAAGARQTAGLATMVGEMFFATPVGLAAGGTAMLMNLRMLAFPNSEFRSSFSQPMPDDALGLCGKTGAAAAHTRVAYLWATRIPNVAPPAIVIGKENSLPTGVRSPLPVAASGGSWKYIDRARQWTLLAENGKPIAVGVRKLGDAQKLEIDLAAAPPGRYTLQANWDWDRFAAAGSIDVRPLGDFKSARLIPSSQDRLVANTGKAPVTLDGGDNGDFEFVTKVEIEKLRDKFASPSAVPFVLPQGLRSGPQKQADLQIDTANLEPGDYKLIVTQLDGKARDIPLAILPPPPVVDNLPIVANQGVSKIDFTLKGQRLDLLQRLEFPQGKAELEPPVPGQKERNLTLELPGDASAGTRFALRGFVDGRSEPLNFAGAIRIAGPRPVISAAIIGEPPNSAIPLDKGELPGGGFLSAMLNVEHLQSNSAVKLACGDRETLALRLGERFGASRAQQLTPNQVFLSFDTSTLPNGCVLEAAIANGAEGESAPYYLGRVVFLPAIENFSVTADAAASDSHRAILTGQYLETIAEVGWAPDQGQPVDALPLPTGDGQKETLQISIPPPPEPDSQLLVWLRNEAKPRMTSIRPNLGQSTQALAQ
jgi:hypothetical protein